MESLETALTLMLNVMNDHTINENTINVDMNEC